MKIENGVTNFAVYEDATEYYGMAEVTLPEITQISEGGQGRGHRRYVRRNVCRTP